MSKGSAPEITLIISNGSNQTHPAILLRKFFAMVFIDSAGKKLDIFIATVFGGVADEKKMKDGFPLVNYDKDKSCYLDFKFQSKILPKNGCRLTNMTDSFCGQTEMVEKVWCDSDTSIIEYDAEKAVADRLEKMYKGIYPKGGVEVSLDPSHRIVYEIKKDDSFTHHCLAVQGQYTRFPENKPGYSLAVPKMVDGLEAINWVKAELTLSEKILDQRIRFSVELAPGQTFYTPDFTWYFAPPPGRAVHEDTAALTLGRNGKEIPNNIQNVRDDTTVLFKEWVDLDIESRRKARVQLKQLDQWKSPFTVLSEVGQITVSFETHDPQKESNRQFMVGLVLAFILAFCSDKTRINDFYECLRKICQCESAGGICNCQAFCNWISILAPVVVLLTFCVYAYNPKVCLPPSWKDCHPWQWRCLNYLRRTSLLSFGILVFYIFGLWPVATNAVGRFISCGWNKWIIVLLFSINLIVSLAHIGIMYLKLKRSPKY